MKIGRWKTKMAVVTAATMLTTMTAYPLTAMADSSGMWRTTAGISASPAICAARQRRSPAMIS